MHLDREDLTLSRGGSGVSREEENRLDAALLYRAGDNTTNTLDLVDTQHRHATLGGSQATWDLARLHEGKKPRISWAIGPQDPWVFIVKIKHCR